MNTTTASDLKLRVEDALTQIRPFLVDDGGDISLTEITEDMVARVIIFGRFIKAHTNEQTPARRL